jgi:glucokinase
VNVYYGIDVGGTSVKTALVSEFGEVIAKRSFSTQASTDVRNMADQMKETLHAMLVDTGISFGAVAGIGVGVPAFLDVSAGVVISAINLGWTNVPLVAILQDVFHLPVAVENDANLAALGESWVGAGQGHGCVLCATVGTGIGGGIVLNGLLFRGVNGMAGEIGHLVVQREDGYRCNCGMTGCLETLCSATAIIRHATELQACGQIPSDAVLTGAQDVFTLAHAGNEGARHVITQAASWLGYGLALTATTLNPDMIVIGGGVSTAKNALLQPVQAAFERYAVPRVVDATSIRLAALGNDAGVVGAARLSAQQRLAHDRRV